MQDPRMSTPPASPAGLQGNARRLSVSTKVSEDDYFILDPQDMYAKAHGATHRLCLKRSFILLIVRREVQQLLKESTDMFEARLRHMKESFDMQMATAMGAISRLTHELTVERERRARIERYVMTALRSPAEELEAVLSGAMSPRNAPSLMAASQSSPAIKPGSPRSHNESDSMPVRTASSSDAVSAIATSPRLRLDLSRATASGTAVAQATITSNGESENRTVSSADAATTSSKATSPRLTRTQSASIITVNGPSSTRSSASDESPRSPPATVHDSPVVRERSGTVMALPSAERSSPTASPRSRNAANSFSFLPKRNTTRIKTSDPNDGGVDTPPSSTGDQSPRGSATATSPSTAIVASAAAGAAQQPKKDEKDAVVKDKKKRSSVFGTIKKTLFRRDKSDKRTSSSGSASVDPVGGGSKNVSRGPNSLEQLFSQVAADPAASSSTSSGAPSSASTEVRTAGSDSSAAVAPIRMDVIGAEIDFTACELVSLPLQVATRMDQISGLRLGSNKFSTWPELASPTLIELDLSLNDILAIPPSISRLPNLKSLFVFGNKISKLPVEIGQLAQLQLLDLSRNSLTELPTAIGSLSNLRELFIFGNKLTAIPAEIKNCLALETLDAGENMIRFLPDEICQLTKLRELNLYLNKISFLPEEIGNLVELRELNVAENFLQDMPLSAGKLKSLGESINLSSNRFAEDGLREAVARGPQETMAYLHRRLYNAIVPVPSMQPVDQPVMSQINLAFAPKGAVVEPMNVWPDSPKMRLSPRAVDVPTPPSAPETAQTGAEETKSEAPIVENAPKAPEESPRQPEVAADPAATPASPTVAPSTPSKEEDVSESSESMSASASASASATNTPRSPDTRSGSDRESKKAMVDGKIAVLIKWAQTVVQEDLKPELERVATNLARNPTQEVITRTIAGLEAFEKSLKRIHQHLPSEFHDSVLDGLLTKLSSNLERKKSVMNIPTVEIEQIRQDLQIRIIDIRSKLTIMTNMLANRELGNHTMIDVIMTVKEMKVSLTAVASNGANQPASRSTASSQPAN